MTDLTQEGTSFQPFTGAQLLQADLLVERLAQAYANCIHREMNGALVDLQKQGYDSRTKCLTYVVVGYYNAGNLRESHMVWVDPETQSPTYMRM